MVVGGRDDVERYRLAGAEGIVAEDPAAVVEAWEALPSDVSLVILTPASASHVRPDFRSGRPLTVVVPA